MTKVRTPRAPHPWLHRLEDSTPPPHLRPTRFHPMSLQVYSTLYPLLFSLTPHLLIIFSPLQNPQYPPPPATTSPCFLHSHLLWLTYSVYEIQNSAASLPIVPPPDAETLSLQGMPESEIKECQSYCHSYPHVSQQLYPSVALMATFNNTTT
jgi:hypothetical protein